MTFFQHSRSRRPHWKLCLLLILFSMLNLYGIPKAEEWERWTRHRESNLKELDHTLFSDFLLSHVDANNPFGMNLLMYSKVDEYDKTKLHEYIHYLQSVPISSYRRDVQLAYWINLYNALTIKIILEHYPVQSIRNISLTPGLFSWGPWDAKLISVEGIPISLNDIYHRILRPAWKDPRIHFALCNASISSPHIRHSAFRSSSIDSDLDQACAEYISHKRAIKFQEGTLVLSSLFSWYRDDLGGSEQMLLNFIRRHANLETEEAILKYRGPVEYTYNWSLNNG